MQTEEWEIAKEAAFLVADNEDLEIDEVVELLSRGERFHVQITREKIDEMEGCK